jgi:hypothetical protein
MGVLFEPIMSMLLAASLGAIAAAAAVYFATADKSCAIVAGLVWLAAMKVYYDWSIDSAWGALDFFPPLGLPFFAGLFALQAAQLVFGLVVLAKAFGWTLGYLSI